MYFEFILFMVQVLDQGFLFLFYRWIFAGKGSHPGGQPSTTQLCGPGPRTLPHPESENAHSLHWGHRLMWRYYSSFQVHERPSVSAWSVCAIWDLVNPTSRSVLRQEGTRFLPPKHKAVHSCRMSRVIQWVRPAGRGKPTSTVDAGLAYSLVQVSKTGSPLSAPLPYGFLGDSDARMQWDRRVLNLPWD